MSGLKARFPEVNFLGVLNQEELSEVYASADVLVFPSRTDTFCLVLLEAMACGLPVAAYPVTGPIDVIEDRQAGALHEDLRTACLQAMQLNRDEVATYSQRFSWRAATEQFFATPHPRSHHGASAPQFTALTPSLGSSTSVPPPVPLN